MNEINKIAFVASECQPFFTSGGLADVIGSLPLPYPGNAFCCPLADTAPLWYGTPSATLHRPNAADISGLCPHHKYLY